MSYESVINEVTNVQVSTAVTLDNPVTTQQSAGAADAGKTVILDATGKIDASLLPASIFAPPRGEMYANNAAFSIVVASADVAYIVDGGFTAGILRGITFPDDHYLMVPIDGIYEVNWSMSLRGSTGTNTEIEGFVVINDTPQTKGTAHAETSIGATARPETIGGHAYFNLMAGDKIKLGILNHTNATDVLMEHASVTVNYKI